MWYVNDANYADSDGDGMRNDLDCAPNNAAAFAVPGDVRDLRFATKTQLSWRAEAPRSGSGTVFDVLRGRLAELPVGSGASETCLSNGTAATTLPKTSPLASGAGHYYLVRGANSCGVGSYGFASSGAERNSGACP